MNPRFYCPPADLPGQALVPDAYIELPEQVAHHACRVLRLGQGEEITLFDGHGLEYPAKLDLQGKKAYAKLGEPLSGCPENTIPLYLVQALTSADKMDWIIQKAVELGAAGIIPIQTTRTLIKLNAERALKRTTHWQDIAISACEQSGRNHIPFVSSVISFAEYVQQSSSAQKLMLVPGADQSLASLNFKPLAPAYHLMIGPEGGWTPEEIHFAQQHKIVAINLGQRILRTETAGLAALAILNFKFEIAFHE